MDVYCAKYECINNDMHGTEYYAGKCKLESVRIDFAGECADFQEEEEE